MQRFDRSSEPPPFTLQGREASIHRKKLANFFLMDEKKRAQTRVPDFGSELDHESLNAGLNRLFRGKCSFCESMVTTMPYRFRPPSDATPVAHNSDSHLYYSWLSNAWENLYSICEGCHPKQQPTYFPVRGKRAPLPTKNQLENYANEEFGLWRDHPPKEKPLLLDPCEKCDFARHLQIDLYGILLPRSKRGQATVEYFELNRDELCSARAIRLNEYLTRLIDSTTPQAHASNDPELFDFAKLEFGGLWYLICREVFLFISPGNPQQLSLSPKQIPLSIKKITRRLDYRLDRDKLENWLNDSLRDVFTYDSYESRGITDSSPTLEVITLNNFKGIERLELAMPPAHKSTEELPPLLQPAMLILGENAAGKSSILEAIALALTTDQGRNELRLDVSSIPLDPELLGAFSAPRSASAQVVLKFDNGTTRTLTIADGQYQIEGSTGAPPVFAYGAFRQYQKKSNSRHSPAKSIINLFQSDKLLANPEQWLLKLDEADFNRVIRILREILSIEGEFEVIERDFDNQRCLIVTAAGGNSRHLTPLSLASSGYRSMLSMICDILHGLMNSNFNVIIESLESAQAVVLIDEIEAHLHPRWKIQIMQALRRALPKVTFIATTHDPLCLRGMQDGEVVVMQRVISDAAASEWPVMVERIAHLPDVGQLTIEQLLTSDFFSLASTDQPETERELAMFADLLAAREKGQPLTSAQDQAWKVFERDVRDALPVGSTEVQRLVQEAVAEYLKERRQASSITLSSLRNAAKTRIVNILRAL
ncbi:TPA: AAA family ATPase [Pseudomonas aeruginosa]|uniref:AAA family ATPase n=1 Tax=Pseudomonas aeruginosa TaxID=287 RepID=UPI000BB6EF6B|nr:AAA family ATPase [Pseudomonas aeruginosa]ELK4826547.1 AAA family ATPase [Pseudomonas aeruginosa]ELM5704367.1 AAA family ATPase [Pseudomonas aeruginosa]MBG5230016.1 AAA family ATPase [Pseudomonas aeruginosa]MBH3618983.1 AAA family ATPase [Pseudomonas aeruginosa]MBM2717282.1 AAA family ATPase [Pseudomonas aeruginosa]